MKETDRNAFTSPQVVAISAATASAVAGLALALARRRVKAAPQPTGIPRSLEDPRIRSAVRAAQEALEDARGRVEVRDGQVIRQAVQSRARPIIETARTDLSPRTREVAALARERTERLRAEGLARSEHLAERVRADVAPAARTWAEEALAEAEDILAGARERAVDLSSAARRTKPADVTAVVSGLMAGVGQTVGTRLGDYGGRRREVARRRLVPTGRMRPRGMPQRAAAQTKHVLGETTMIAAWSGALGAVIFFGLLTAEQRERVKSFVKGAFAQMRDLGQDFQGEEPETPPSLD